MALRGAAFACGIVAAVVLAQPSFATAYTVAYSGTDQDGAFSASLVLDLTSSGDAATLVSGERNGVAVTVLSGYAFADDRLSLTEPFVSLGGFSYAITGGETFNIFFDSTATTGTGYFEANSVTNPDGTIFEPYYAIDSITVNGRLIEGSVPEPASWTMMVGGFGLAGAALRRRQRTTVAFA